MQRYIVRLGHARLGGGRLGYTGFLLNIFIKINAFKILQYIGT